MKGKLAILLTALLGFGVASFVFAQEARKADQVNTQDVAANTNSVTVNNTATVNNAEINAETNAVTNAVTNQEAAPAAAPATKY